jgi:hypothetical protein
MLQQFLGFSLLFSMLLWAQPSLATKRIAPIEKLTPNPKLLPAREVGLCRKLMAPASPVAPSLREIRVSKTQAYSKRDLLRFVNFLLESRFVVSSSTLTVESSFVRSLLTKKFGVALAGKDLYQELQKHFSTVEDAVVATNEGKKLKLERNDADYKTWALPILVKLAREVEQAGLPFEAEFLKKHSSQVGMELAKIYGYPVRGDQILYRAEKLEASIDQIRKMAGLPIRSANLERVQQENEVPWSQELITRFLTIPSTKFICVTGAMKFQTCYSTRRVFASRSQLLRRKFTSSMAAGLKQRRL